MTVTEAAAVLGGAVVTCAGEAAAREVRGGYVSDLLSDVMGNAREGDLWITLQKHVNTIAVAQLKSLAGIVLVNGRRPDADTAARAEEERIPVISTSLEAYEAAGALYEAGVRGRRRT
jgi:hypothetical protein